MNLGGRIERERAAQGLTQQELAARVSPLPHTKPGAEEKGRLSQQSLDRLEKRDSKTSEHAVGIADALGVSLRWLLTGAGRKDDRDWPFPRVARERWDACDDTDRGYVQAAVNRALSECEATRAGKPAPTQEPSEADRHDAMLRAIYRFGEHAVALSDLARKGEPTGYAIGQQVQDTLKRILDLAGIEAPSRPLSLPAQLDESRSPESDPTTPRPAGRSK